jgi:membrane fusion protein (multidrug efflux system)
MNRAFSEATVPASPDQALRRFRVTAILLAALAAVTAITVISCKQEAAPPPPPLTVQVMELMATNVPIVTEFIGQLDSPQNIEVRARVEAFVEQMPFAEGTEVKQGELLFRLDDRPYQQRLNAANGMLAEANAALAKYQADVTRLAPLATNRAIPKQDLDNALASADVGKASVTSAWARVESAQLDLSYCVVRAPTNGLIGAKQVSVGSLVGKGEPTLMATMSTLDPIWFYCNIGEAQYLKAQAESRRTGTNLEDLLITLILANGAEHPDKGRIVFLDRAMDVKTGTLRVRASFPNPAKEKGLRPGMFARIKVEVGIRPDSILVPERAVTELQGKNFAWVIGADDKASQRAVEVGETIGESVLIVKGLEAGERIITEGLQKVREGTPVQPKTAAQMAEAAQHAEVQPAKDGAAKRGKE